MEIDPIVGIENLYHWDVEIRPILEIENLYHWDVEIATMYILKILKLVPLRYWNWTYSINLKLVPLRCGNWIYMLEIENLHHWDVEIGPILRLIIRKICSYVIQWTFIIQWSFRAWKFLEALLKWIEKISTRNL